MTRDPASGEAAERVAPLAEALGAEVGSSGEVAPGLRLNAAIWGPDLASELLFIGDAGTTEASRPRGGMTSISIPTNRAHCG